MRLAKRVEMVGMAEEGASFLDLFRHLVDGGLPERDAYLDAQRICRGGMVKGGAPFTKDACYLAGLFDVYDFISRALRFQTPILGDLLLCGRIALEDTLALGQDFYRVAANLPILSTVTGVASIVVETDATPGPMDVPSFSAADVLVGSQEILRVDSDRITIAIA